MTKLTTVLGEYPHVCSLLSGDVPLAGYAIEAVEVPTLRWTRCALIIHSSLANSR